MIISDKLKDEIINFNKADYPMIGKKMSLKNVFKLLQVIQNLK